MATIHLTFYVYLNDEAEVKRMQGLYPNGWEHGPQPAATEYGIPFESREFPFTGPSVRTAWHSREASGKFLYDRTVFRIDKGGFWGWVGGSDRFIWLGFFRLVPATAPLEGSADSGAGPHEAAPIPRRKFATGFQQVGGAGGGGGEDATGIVARQFGRTPGSFGIGVRSASNILGIFNTTVGGGAISHGWERIYVRVQRLPGTTVTFWNASATGSGGTLRLKVSTSGQIVVVTVDNSSVETIVGSSAALTLDTWYRLDVTYEWFVLNDGSADNIHVKINLFVNGVSVVLGSPMVRPAFSTPGTHSNSQLGNTGSGHSLVMDFADWIGAECPTRFRYGVNAWAAGTNYTSGTGAAAHVTAVHNGKTKTYRAIANSGPANGGAVAPPNAAKWVQVTGPVDFYSGSHVVYVPPTGFGPQHVAADWTQPPAASAGEWQTLDRRVLEGASSLKVLSAGAAASVLEVTTDAPLLGLGAVAVSVGIHAQLATGTHNLGISVAGGAYLDTVRAMNATEQWYTAIDPSSGALTAPRDIRPLTLRLSKGVNAATPNDVGGLGAQVEYIGVWDACDYSVDPTVTPVPEAPEEPRHPGAHNGPYEDSAWASLTSTPPFGGVEAFGGTIVGAETLQTLTFPVPIHFFWIRPLTGAVSPGARWWSSMLASHAGVEGSPFIAGGILADRDKAYVPAVPATDPEERYRIRLIGNASPANDLTRSYQYIALSDPGARFLLNGNFRYGSHVADNGTIHQMVDSAFLAAFLLVWQENLSPTGDTATTRLWAKGPGHAAAEASKVDAAATASALNFATTGQLQAFSGINNFGVGGAYAAFRTLENNAHVSGTLPVVFQTRAYVGNGSATRDIALTPATGSLRPLWAMVVPDNGAAYWRDPSHATLVSQQVASSTINSANGIIGGGVDMITVGSALNTNGVDYSVLVLVGGSVAGTDGWSANGTFILALPDMPGGTQFDAPTLTEDEIDVIEEDQDNPQPEPTPDLPEEPDLDVETPLPGTDLFCASFSQKAVNLALSRIGVSKTIGNVVTDVTKEAELGRLHIKADVEMVLSRFPWEFARKYATLVLVDGAPSDPVNADWTFSYRRPTDCVFERRIAAARGNAVNPTPPAFALGRDSSGGLIFCNEEDARLEYTARGLCPAYEGDDLFKEALVWKLAASLAPALSRMPDKIAGALEQYEATIAKAYDVMRPNAPGPVTEADPAAFDQTATAAAANLAVINAALIRIGARTIPSIAADSREALSVRVVFESELQSALRGFAWAFATRYAELALVAGPATWDDPLVQTYDVARTYEENDAVIVGSVVYYALRQTLADYPDASPLDWTTELPDDANADWLRAYRLPDDSVFARRLVKPGGRRTYDPDPLPFKLGTDEGGDLLYTDAEQPVLEYTSRLNATVSRSDALFKDALAWRLAAALAPSLAQIDPEEVEQGRGPDATSVAQKSPSVKANKAAARERVARWAMANYLGVLEQAKVSTANEKQDEPDGDAPWITGR